MLFLISTILIASLVALITYYNWAFQYWKKKNVPTLKPTIPFGNLKNPLFNHVSPSYAFRDYYFSMKQKGAKHAGFYALSTPYYMPLSLDMIKNIMTKDFEHFLDRGSYYDEEHDPLSAHLFALGGTKWRNLRVKLTPTFTSGKMKMMFQTFIECGKLFKESIDKSVGENEGKAIDIHEVLARFTTDIIGSCAFGLDCQSIAEEDSEFRKAGKSAMTETKWLLIKFNFGQSFPKLARFLRVSIVPKDASDFFMDIVEKTIKYRETNNVTRNDFLQILIDIKNNKLSEDIKEEHDGKTLSIQEVAAQCFLFFLAGFSTTSGAMTFAMLEMCLNTEIQDKVRKEVNYVLNKHNGEITYEGLMEMKYLEQVLNEVLRKYPSVPFLNRECVKDYKVPGEDLIIEKGTVIVIPALGLHYDPEYYPDPHVFDPERFSEENKHTRNPYTHLPFGEGPRNCIGMRFGKMQFKMGIATLLKNYKFSLHPKTRTPIELNQDTFTPIVNGKVWLKGERI